MSLDLSLFFPTFLRHAVRAFPQCACAAWVPRGFSLLLLLYTVIYTYTDATDYEIRSLLFSGSSRRISVYSFSCILYCIVGRWNSSVKLCRTRVYSSAIYCEAREKSRYIIYGRSISGKRGALGWANEIISQNNGQTPRDRWWRWCITTL